MRFKLILYSLLIIMLLSACNDAISDNNTNDELAEVEQLNEEQSDENDLLDVEGDLIAFDINDLDFTNLRTEVQSLDEIFRLDDALFRSSQISDALDSFWILTEKVQGIIPKETLEEVGNTGWEEQNLGFLNWTSIVEATLMKQEFQIKWLELELAMKQYHLGKKDQTAIDLAESEFLTAKESFQLFLDSYRIAD